MLKKYLFPIAYISWMVFVTWSSLFSFSGHNLSKYPIFQVPHMDKLVHFTFYFVAVLLGTLTIRSGKAGKIGLGKSLWIMVAGMIVFGMLIEGIQHIYTNDRIGDLYDILANTMGAIGGALALKYIFSGPFGLKWGQ